MACTLDLKKGSNNEILQWDPKEIPSTKPFVHIVTSPTDKLTTQDDTKFIKTKSLIYSAFHQNARYVNFEVGYSKTAKWFDHLDDKWNDYSNFFVGVF